MSVNQTLDRLALDAGGLDGLCHRDPHFFGGSLQEHLPQLVAILCFLVPLPPDHLQLPLDFPQTLQGVPQLLPELTDSLVELIPVLLAVL